MKRTAFVMVVFVFVLTGCASAETDKEKTAISTKSAVSINSSQAPTALPLDYEAMTEPPILTVSTLNAVDSVSVSCGYSHWSCAMPDGTTTTILACGAHPLDQQEYPILYTAFPAGTLIPVEETFGAAGYIFRTLPQMRGEQTDISTDIFDALNGLEYLPYTCDGLPEYRLTAADGTVYAINISDKWVWRGNNEQAELSDELIILLKENGN